MLFRSKSPTILNVVPTPIPSLISIGMTVIPTPLSDIWSETCSGLAKYVKTVSTGALISIDFLTVVNVGNFPSLHLKLLSFFCVIICIILNGGDLDR